ncbi:hypothetical protein Gotri_015418 [Gossypium trilobum]|uniref:Uncharacterized protein n=1 Tax=Gossypium trilobum TaxID=34281 RepID=A0A7J9E026_9ROSI|nr:hypothetical protein [Gossypium trilobum]
MTSPPSPIRRLSAEQENSVIVSALKNVITGSVPSSSSSSTVDVAADFGLNFGTLTMAGGSSSSSSASLVLQPSEVMEKCHVCEFDGCLGCNLFPPSQQEDKNGATASNKTTKREKKNYRGKNASFEMGLGTEFWDGISNDDEIQQWMMMTGFGADNNNNSSDSAMTSTRNANSPRYQF